MFWRNDLTHETEREIGRTLYTKLRCGYLVAMTLNFLIDESFDMRLWNMLCNLTTQGLSFAYETRNVRSFGETKAREPNPKTESDAESGANARLVFGVFEDVGQEDLVVRSIACSAGDLYFRFLNVARTLLADRPGLAAKLHDAFSKAWFAWIWRKEHLPDLLACYASQRDKSVSARARGKKAGSTATAR